MTTNSTSPIIKSQSLMPSSKARPLLSGDKILKVRGVVFDQVSFASKLLTLKVSIDDISAIWALALHPEAMSAYPQGYEIVAFEQAICLGRYSGEYRHWTQCRLAYFRRLNKDTGLSEQEKEDANLIHDTVQSCAHNRRFIITKRGYYGLAPLCTRENDLCCVIFGAKSPFILRRAEMSNHYRVVGDVSIPGKTATHNELDRFKIEEHDHMMLQLGEKFCRDWEGYGLKEQNIYLC